MCAFNKVLAHIVAMCDTNMPFIGLRIEVGIKKIFCFILPLPCFRSWPLDVTIWQICGHVLTLEFPCQLSLPDSVFCTVLLKSC